MNPEKPSFEENQQDEIDKKFEEILNDPELLENLNRIKKQEQGLTPEEEKDFLEKWYKEQQERAEQGLIPPPTMDAITEAYKYQKKKIEEKNNNEKGPET